MSVPAGSSQRHLTVQVDYQFLVALMQVSGESDPAQVVQQALTGLWQFHNAQPKLTETSVISKKPRLLRPRPPPTHVCRL